MIINLCALCCASQKFKKYFEQTISIIGLKMCHCDTVGKKKKEYNFPEFSIFIEPLLYVYTSILS